ncbi:MAG: hypothetical protein HKO53_07875 [Gemmatimonadetes bacterium]|nr:hypothetical protein [Gemmatimonadota bacterium]
MAEPTALVVRFQDENTKDTTVDKVILEIDGTPVEKTSAPYSFPLENAGTGTLRFEKKGLFPYHFPVEVKQTGDDFTLTFANAARDRPRMAQLVKVTASAGGDSKSQNLLTFTLRKPREVVLLTAHDYSGGAIYRIFGVTRMRDLARQGLIDDNTVITFFECDTGQRSHWVLGRSKVKTARHAIKTGWCQMSEELVGTVAPDLKKHPGEGAIGITHIYRYLEDVGRARKGTVVEFSIWSHSWVEGPILFNTNQRDDYRWGGKKQDERDPQDHDARFLKDFNDTNMPHRKDFKAAFAPDPFVRIWGCLVMPIYRKAINRARKARRDTQLLRLTDEERQGYFNLRRFPDTPIGVRELLKEEGYRANYMYQLSKVIGAPVWGSPPGTGSDYLISGRRYWMYVPEYEMKLRREQRVKVKKYFYNELNYLKKHMGWTFSSDWYLKYSA